MKYLINEEDLTPYEDHECPPPIEVPRNSMGVNLEAWMPWEKEQPWLDLVNIADPWDRDPNILWLATHQQGDPQTVFRVQYDGQLEWKNAEWLDDNHIIADLSRNFGVDTSNGQLLSCRPANTTLGVSLKWVEDARKYSWLRYLKPLRTNIAEERTDMEVLQLIDQIVEISQLTGTRPWICIHHEWSEALLSLIALRLQGLNPIIEPSNEVWNNQFSSAKYFLAMEPPLYADQNRSRYAHFSQWADGVFTLFKETLGEDGCTTVIGSQWTNPWVTERVLQFCSPDAVAVAPYFGRDTGLRNASYDPMAMAVICGDDIADTKQLLEAHKEAADGLPIWAYEGGSHVFPVHALTEEHENALWDFNESAVMQSLMEDHLRAWYENGGGPYTAFVLHKGHRKNGHADIADNPRKRIPLESYISP